MDFSVPGTATDIVRKRNVNGPNVVTAIRSRGVREYRRVKWTP